jgi:RNA polymerase sigma factor (sigma-70 family)
VEQLDALEATDPCRSIEDLWKRYKPAVWARLNRPPIPEDVAEDLLVEVFSIMNKILKNEGIPRPPGRTLAAIATHLICNHVRTRRRQPCFVPAEALDTEPMPSSRSSPQAALQRAQREHFVHMILSLMESRDSQLIELVDFFELTEVDIAGALGMSVDTVRYRVSMARKRFRALAELNHAELGGEL